MLFRSTALHFTAAATESHEINVTTNQDSWTAISNQNWCKVTQDKNKLIVKADPNTTETSPAPATITISATPTWIDGILSTDKSTEWK